MKDYLKIFKAPLSRAVARIPVRPTTSVLGVLFKMAALSGVIAGLAENLQFKDDGCETATSDVQVKSFRVT